MTWAAIGLTATIMAVGLASLWWGYRVGWAEGESKYQEMSDITWCRLHHGVLNEDDHRCDFNDDDQECDVVAVYRKI